MSGDARCAWLLTLDQSRWDALPLAFAMPTPRITAHALAIAFLAGEFEKDQLVARASRTLGRRPRWLTPLAERVAAAYETQTRPRRAALATFLLGDRGFRAACAGGSPGIADWTNDEPAMRPWPQTADWALPALRSVRELAAWLDVSLRELDWFADIRSWEAKRSSGALRHYHYRIESKRFGQVRLIEAPKPRLKAIQRRLLNELLELIPPHEAAHGFRRGRSIKSFAAPHVGQTAVLKIDLQDFFPSIAAARVQALFRTVGYPEPVADKLAGLCCNATPADAWNNCDTGGDAAQHRRARRLYEQPHLPQGAPTSPAIANLCAYRLDCRLAALAASAGATYTRYADDLAFSGGPEFARRASRFQTHVCATVMEEGWAVHHRKTRLMRQGVCQRLAGVNVNERVNLCRRDFDLLKATLANCLRLGTASQNRAGHADFCSHLEGRVSYVEFINPDRGAKLRRLFERIEW